MRIFREETTHSSSGEDYDFFAKLKEKSLQLLLVLPKMIDKPSFKLNMTNDLIPSMIKSQFSTIQDLFEVFEDHRNYIINSETCQVGIKVKTLVKNKIIELIEKIKLHKIQPDQKRDHILGVKVIQQADLKVLQQSQLKSNLMIEQLQEQNKKLILQQKKMMMMIQKLSAKLVLYEDGLRESKDFGQDVMKLKKEVEMLGNKEQILEQKFGLILDKFEHEEKEKEQRLEKKVERIEIFEEDDPPFSKIRRNPWMGIKIDPDLPLKQQRWHYYNEKCRYAELFDLASNSATYKGQEGVSTQMLVDYKIDREHIHLIQIVISKTKDRLIRVGVVDIKKRLYQRTSFDTHDAICLMGKNSTATYSSGGVLYSKTQGIGFKEGDIISLEIKLKDNVVNWHVNNWKESGVKSDVLSQEGRIWVPYVEFQTPGDTVDLIQTKTKLILQSYWPDEQSSSQGPSEISFERSIKMDEQQNNSYRRNSIKKIVSEVSK